MMRQFLFFLTLVLPPLTAALNPHFIKKFFFINSSNKLSYQLFHVADRILSYSIDDSKTGPVPQYLSIDIESREVVPILSDLVPACDQGPSTFQRLHFHPTSSSLLYYCAANASLLTLNHESYNVETSIKTTALKNWTEVKIINEGDGVAVLAIGPLFTNASKPSQLMRFNLTSKKLSTIVRLEANFAPGEFVVGYAASHSSSYILTNLVKGPSLTINVYNIKFNGTKYQLTRFVNLYSPTCPKKVITQIFGLGNLIAINNGNLLTFYDHHGKTVHSIPKLAEKEVLFDLYQLAVASETGTNSLYAQFINDTIIHLTVHEDSIESRVIGGGADMQIAFGDGSTSNLMLTLNSSKTNFAITNLETSKVIYSSVTGVDSLMMTNSTYAVVESPSVLVNSTLYIFNRETDALMKKYSITQFYHYHKDQHILSFLNSTGSLNITCLLTHINLINGAITKSWVFPGLETCLGSFVDINFADLHHPNVIISRLGIVNKYMIATPSTGQIFFQPPNPGSFIRNDSRIIVPNYKNLSFYYLDTTPETKTVNVYYYEYDSSSGEYEQQSDFELPDTPVDKFYSSFSEGKVIALSNSSFTFIDLQEQQTESFDFDEKWNSISTLKNADDEELLIFFSRPYSNQKGNKPAIYGPYGLETLPEVSNYTAGAAAAEICAYWILDGLISTVSVVRFYSFCEEPWRMSQIVM